MTDQYKTVAREMVTRCKIQRSLFIAHVRETPTEEEARAFIARVSSEHKQATHNCWAYRIGIGKEEVSYFDDDGEPSGTAGKPIYGAILSRDITNVAVVVTRYFGGKKLGVRGLIEAYAGAAGDAIDHAGIITRRLTTTFTFTCSYAQLDQVHHLLNQVEGEILESNYTDRVELTIAVPRSRGPQVAKALAELGR
ncbi:MAG TPA: YigZ family protein [Firmicutes bacterium]|nr:YigZ family protein [Bacillota bacterium]